MFKSILPDISIGAMLFDESGKLTFSRHEKGHSWTRNAWNYMFSMISGAGGGNVNSFGAGFMSGKRYGGVVNYSPAYCVNKGSTSTVATYGLIPSGTSALQGIVLGTGSTAFSTESFCLAAPIAHGTGPGQLSYSAEIAPVISYASKIWRAANMRNFSNLSGGNITVTEMGLFFSGSMFSSNDYFMLSRDVLSSPILVESLATLQFTFNIDFDFSAID